MIEVAEGDNPSSHSETAPSPISDMRREIEATDAMDWASATGTFQKPKKRIMPIHASTMIQRGVESAPQSQSCGAAAGTTLAERMVPPTLALVRTVFEFMAANRAERVRKSSMYEDSKSSPSASILSSSHRPLLAASRTGSASKWSPPALASTMCPPALSSWASPLETRPGQNGWRGTARHRARPSPKSGLRAEAMSSPLGRGAAPPPAPNGAGRCLYVMRRAA
mmetsp:Transcript_29640/g.90950  ORF Transcript_29640/g.90950 Transcript_29640/m.90950 type:complete len:224 (+) Transcript_29640:1422-2093(+)